MAQKPDWKEEHRKLELRTTDDRFRQECRIAQLQKHISTLVGVIERLMDPNRRFRD